VDLDDGSILRADLLIGADGIHSRVRELALDPESRFLRYLGYHTAAYSFTDPGLHRRLGNEIRLLTVPGRQAGLYPLRDGQIGAFYVHTAAQPALPGDPRAALARVYADLGWVVPAALARYQARVAPMAKLEQAAGRRTAGWVIPATRGRIAARDAALHLAALPGLRRLLRPILTPAAPSLVSPNP
jgi:hypothetical protein